MPHLHFIVNPAAGGSSSLHKFHLIEEFLNRREQEYSVVYSEYAGHASELARQALAAGRDIVVAAGGDGTAREVAQELVHTGVPMGILPLGTGNDLAKTLHIPADPVQALGLLLEGEIRTMDVALAGDQTFINVFGFGFDVEVLQKTRYYKNHVHGGIAYLLGILHALVGLRAHPVTLSTPRETIREEVLLVAVGNGKFIGGGMMVTPHADVSDGLLDVCVIRRASRCMVLYCLARFIRGKHVDLDIVRYFQVEEIAIEDMPELAVQLDGEVMRERPALIRVQPKALQLIAGGTP